MPVNTKGLFVGEVKSAEDHDMIAEQLLDLLGGRSFTLVKVYRIEGRKGTGIEVMEDANLRLTNSHDYKSDIESESYIGRPHESVTLFNVTNRLTDQADTVRILTGTTVQIRERGAVIARLLDDKVFISYSITL